MSLAPCPPTHEARDPRADPGGPGPRAPNHLVLSAHDYRTPRRANIHFIAAELARRGPTRFFSLRYSLLSRWKGDARLALDDRANRIEMHDGVECYLWRALVHPFNSRRRWARPLEDAMFAWYADHPPAVLERWIAEADVIVFESGTAVAFIEAARRLNPAARLVYRASDSLAAINAAHWVERRFDRVAPMLDVIALVSPAMAPAIASRDNVFHVGHGLDPGLDALGDPAPYDPGIHAVAVGSMLFDPRVFVAASRVFPEITFHVIGSGQGRHPGYGDNVVVYGEMPHARTIPYIKHARIGFAPYASQEVPAYLADSSMKLLQYDYFGLPAVCPHVVVGGRDGRHGYVPGDEASLIAAIRSALAQPRARPRRLLDWAEVTDRVLDPARYPDTRIDHAGLAAGLA
ncbi:glycosyltransferase family 1 protein [Luteimonas kalidii]|uniref:Glycosyltransferase family 1 protein n=1 Tax=Luteimonas kalidii TaxID=3042025 RepID=A0ABT6JYB4_9GAMM|nr:glycosyltransferase family 1 protein [Luteimonas kalidii]MDH5835574.1 glycosyltransferase family 1 protein [Luteimonas kalidii]